MTAAAAPVIIVAMTIGDPWFTGRRRRVRAALYGVSAILTATSALGIVVGHVRPALRAADEPAVALLLDQGGVAGLVGLAAIAALTVYAWRAELSGALAASGTSLLAMAAVVHPWLDARATGLDRAAAQGAIATIALAVVLLARMVGDLLLDAAEHRARAGGDLLPTTTSMPRRQPART